MAVQNKDQSSSTIRGYPHSFVGLCEVKITQTSSTRQGNMYIGVDPGTTKIVIKPCEVGWDDDDDDWAIPGIASRRGEDPWYTCESTRQTREKIRHIEGVSTYNPRLVDNSSYCTNPAGKLPIIGVMYDWVDGIPLSCFWPVATDVQRSFIIQKLSEINDIIGTGWDWNTGNVIIQTTDDGSINLVLIDNQRMRNGCTANSLIRKLTSVVPHNA